jgi:hypothetical protein
MPIKAMVFPINRHKSTPQTRGPMLEPKCDALKRGKNAGYRGAWEELARDLERELMLQRAKNFIPSILARLFRRSTTNREG